MNEQDRGYWRPSARHLRELWSSRLTALLIAAIVLLGVISFVAERSLTTLRSGNALVVHTERVRLHIGNVLQLLTDVETGIRGYAQSADPQYLEPSQAAIPQLPPALASLKRLVADNPQQLAAATAFEQLVQERIDLSLQVSRYVQDGNLAAARALIASAGGRRGMDAARVAAAQMQSEEMRLLELRVTGSEQALHDTQVVLWVTGALAVLLLLVIAYSTMRYGARIRRSEKILATTLRSVGDAVISTDPTGTVQFMNAVAERLTGWSLKSARGCRLEEVFRVVNEQTRAVVENPVVKVVRAGGIVGLANHTILIARDGRETAIEDSGAPILDDGELAGVVLVFRDASIQREAERALRASEARLRESNADLERRVHERALARSLTWQLSPDLLGALNSSGYFETSNPAWQTILGWSEAEVASTSIFELLHPDDAQHTRAGFELTQAGQPALNFVNRYRCKDGSYRWISWVGIPEDKYVYCTGRDITAERAAALELSAAQEALRQSQKMEAIGQLTGGIAHDFNNLLTGIIGALDVIRRRLRANKLEDIPRFLDAAAACARSAGALTHRLLAFARRQSLNPRPNQISRLITGMEDLLDRTLGEQIKLHCRLADGLWTAFIDANQLENAILNLAINARDAMPYGGQLTIAATNVHVNAAGATLTEEPAPGDYVVIRVTDTGTGMSPEVLAKAADPFFTTKAAGEGTGLGLAVISGFIQQSGGYWKIQSELGQGTTVQLYLPRSLQDVVTPEVAAIETPRGQGETILIVEDNPSVRTILSEALGDLGYKVLAASDARPAIAFLQSAQVIDLLISDVILPHINGSKLAEIARRSRPDLKILFITGYAGNAIVQSDLLQPGVELMAKPFSLDTFGAKVHALIH